MGSYLGQNFLMNKSKLRKIADVLELKKGDTVIEIGPGHGELTEKIIEKLKDLKIEKFRIIAIEKDVKLIKNLEFRIKDLGLDKNIKVIEGDALKILSALSESFKFQVSSFKIIGNIPYYITGYLLRTISELKFKPEIVVLTIQKEVAQRICAQPPKMNLLAASVQFWAEPKIIGYISKKDFRPAPKVDSAIVKLVIKQLSNYEITRLPNYYRFIKILFKQPRKTILNNLCAAKNTNTDGCRDKLLETGINPSGRPQNLTIGQIKNLSI
ncbi:MAG: 16S rRNA (adenine(1518)-N(6)/adenine(1519)-N(6))-dimethyltransferase RsmA [Spirochaetota bacterium]